MALREFPFTIVYAENDRTIIAAFYHATEAWEVFRGMRNNSAWHDYILDVRCSDGTVKSIPMGEIFSMTEESHRNIFLAFIKGVMYTK